METRQHSEKLIYEWRLDKSRVGDVTGARKILADLPPDSASVAMDAAYDARDIYEMVEEKGARPIIKPRKNARRTELNARGRAIRRMDAHPALWHREYDRWPITESVNYALKARFGQRLYSHGLRRQRKEMGFRILVYNTNLSLRRLVRREFAGRG